MSPPRSGLTSNKGDTDSSVSQKVGNQLANSWRHTGSDKELNHLRQSTRNLYAWSSSDLKLLYPPHISNRMFITACLSTLPCVVVAWLQCLPDMALGTLMVFLCSINYWRSPKRGLRRNIDIFNSVVVVHYHIYCAWECDYWVTLAYFVGAFMCCGMGCYNVSNYYRARGNLHMDSVFHCCMHMLGMVCNVFLYSHLAKTRAQNNSSLHFDLGESLWLDYLVGDFMPNTCHESIIDFDLYNLFSSVSFN